MEKIFNRLMDYQSRLRNTPYQIKKNNVSYIILIVFIFLFNKKVLKNPIINKNKTEEIINSVVL